jgi:hypothetical protein
VGRALLRSCSTSGLSDELIDSGYTEFIAADQAFVSGVSAMTDRSRNWRQAS